MKGICNIFKVTYNHGLLWTVQRSLASQSQTELSSVKYNVKRKHFSKLHQDDVTYFRSVLNSDRVLTDPSDVEPYNIDWIKSCKGQSSLVLKPKTTEEVSTILRFCNERNLAVCPQGGNTGLVGGSVPVFDEIILNMSLMNKVISLDEVSGALVCQAGCILETLDQYVRSHDLIMPLDLGAKGTCQIGGNVSTNAGGLRLLRYGNLHGTVLGLEAVKADGVIIDTLQILKKDNTGYHLKHLFIGSEGTLGVVTKVAIQCPALPRSVNLAMFGVQSFEDILHLYKRAKAALGEILSAFEMADAAAMDASFKAKQISNPISDSEFYVLVETHGSDETHDEDKLSRFLQREMDAGLIRDGTVVSDPAKLQSIWSLREDISNAVLLDGYVYKYDVSLPMSDFYSLVPALRQRLGDKVTRVCGYGHIGDSNIHINVSCAQHSAEVMALLEPHVFEQVSRLQGSVSAEHGVGFRKPQYMHYSKSQSSIELMRQLKTTMDPKGILNPYKVLA